MFRSKQSGGPSSALSHPLRSISERLRLTFVALFMLAILIVPVHADPPQYISNSTTDNPNDDGKATITDTITYIVTFLSDLPPLLAQVQDSNLGQVFTMSPIVGPTPPLYQYSYTLPNPIVEGNVNGTTPNSPTTLILVNASGVTTVSGDTVMSKVIFDNKPPELSGPFSMTVNGNPYTSQVLHLNDALGLSQNMSAVYQPGETATLDLSAFTGFGSVIMSTANPHTANYTITNQVDMTGSFRLSATDPNGNATNAIVLTNVAIDSKPPAISSTNVTLNPVGLARPGTQVTVQVVLAENDGDTVTASCTYLGGTSLPLTLTGGTTYAGTFTVASSPPMTSFFGSTHVDVSVTDNGMNVATASTDAFSLDNRLPGMPTTPSASITQMNAPTGDGIGIIGDYLTIEATATWDPVQYPTAHVYADLTTLGGANNVELTRYGQNTFALTYLLPSGISEESPTKSFNVTAIDTSTGNTIQNWTTPVVAIDNTGPKFVSATLTRISGTGTSYKTNDQFQIRVQVNDLPVPEMGLVSAQLASLSAIYTNAQPLNPETGNPGFFQGTFTIGSFSPGLGWDLPAFDIRIIASDHAGNIATTSVNTGIPLDNEPVNVATVTWSVKHNLYPSLDAGCARVGDTVSFHIRVASTPTDAIQAIIDLSGIGLSSSQAMTASASNPGWYDHIIPSLAAGTINRTDINFPMRIEDDNGNQAISSVTITIDDNPPTISDVTVTRAAGAGTIRIGDAVTVRATVTGVETGSASVDLRRFGATTYPTLLTNVFGNTWETTLTVATGNPLLDDSGYIVTVTGNDDAWNIASASSQPMSIDTDPPVYIVATWSVYEPLNGTDHAYIRLNDQLTLNVAVKPATDITVKVDLTGIGSVTPTLSLSGIPTANTATYTITFTIAEGPRNFGATLPIIITDDASNTAYTSALMPPASPLEFSLPMFDQVLPQPSGRLNLSVTRRDPTIDSLGLNVINLNRYLAFGWPVSATGRDAPGECRIDLSLVGSSSIEPMTWAALPVASYGYFMNAASLGVTLEDPAYIFIATMTDKAGNSIATTTALSYIVDCIPPVINSVSAEVVGGGIATIGRQILFRSNVSLADGNAPTVNLTTLGGSAVQQMTSAGGNDFTHTVTVPSGVWESNAASWVVSIFDSHGNIVSSSTNTLQIDNKPPQAGALQVSWIDVPADGMIRLGDTASFTIAISDPANAGTATVDLTSIGRGSAVQMVYGGSSFSLLLPTLPTGAEYLNYTFTALVTDANGNPLTVTSTAITEVDCQSPGFASCGILLSQDNGDNPITGIANTGDIVTVYASITSSIDAVASASISSGSISLATGTMAYVAARNRHEAEFTIPAGSGIWNLSYTPLTFQATATDNVGNSSWTVSAQSTFTVKNKPPEIDTVSFALTTNQNLLTFGGIPVFNVGSGSADKLIATASLKNGELVTSGILDLSQIPGAPSALALVSAGNSAGTASVDLSKYPLTEWRNALFTLTLRDQAGNPVSTGTQFVVDTIRPSLTGATFEGTTFNIRISEEYESSSVASLGAEWRLIGSTSTGLLASMPLSVGTFSTLGWNDFDIQLDLNARRTLSTWASTPLYLEVTSVATAPLTDLAGNWLPGTSRYPVTITDSTWREPTKLTNFVIDTSNWPASISLDLVFDRAMDTTTLIASNGVLLVSPIAYDFANIDYTIGYVFQASDTPSWPTSSQLHIELCDSARDWFARKLGSGTTVLRFANRTSARVFARDQLGKAVTNYPTSAPFASSAVTRPPASSFAVIDPPGNITLTVGSGTLDINLSERALLYSNDFNDIDGTAPTMGMPVPTYAKRTTRYHSRLVLHDIGADPATFTRLTLQPLDLAKNPQMASTAVHLLLTDADTANIIAMFRNNAVPIWRMRVDDNAFGNWWDQPSQLYLPSGNPGSMGMNPPTSTGTARMVAAAISDPPPTRNAAAGTLFFEFDFEPTFIGNTPVPLSSAVPTARIASASGETLATGTFVSWTTRTVAGKTRYSARFSNDAALPVNVQAINGRLEIWNISDIFGNTLYSQAVPAATSTVYDLNLRSTTDARGFSSGTSQLVFDTLSPTVTSITPTTISRLAANAGIFTVTFSEPMNTSAGTPQLTLSTGTTTLGFTFRGWSADGTIATYSNNSAFTDTLAQGIWTYSLTAAGADPAANAFAGTTQAGEVRTQAPSVSTIRFTQVRSLLSPTPVTDQPQNLPYSPANGIATVSIAYAATAMNPAHTLRFVSGSASWTTLITLDAGQMNGTATIDAALFGSPGATGPASYLAQIYDTQGNTSDVATFVYDFLGANLDAFALTGVGSFVGNVYYAATSTLLTASAHATNATDTQVLTVKPSGGATSTLTLNQPTSGSYTNQIASSFPEGDYLLGLSDMAGNAHTGLAAVALRIDRTAPTVTSITPSSSQIGNTLAGSGIFDLAFSEPMNGDPLFIPTLRLATTTPITTAPACSSSTIFLTFTGWISSTTARFTNVANIDSAYRPGNYAYSVSGGRDLAGNATAFTPGAVLDVQGQGPAAGIAVYTLHNRISAAIALKDSPLSGTADPGIATISISYSNANPPNPQHSLLIFNSAGVQVASYAVPTGQANASVTVDVSDWGVGSSPVDPVASATYRFKLVDGLGNMSDYNPTPFLYDSLGATANAIAFTGIVGIASGGHQYYSPAAGNFTLTMTGTNATDQQRLVIFNEAAIATSASLMTSPSANNHAITTGSTLAAGNYTFSFADLAGNFADGTASTVSVIADSTAPTVASATPVSIGTLAAGAATFTIIFSEPMNPDLAYIPAVSLATTTAGGVTRITLVPTPLSADCWISSTTCRFTNTTAITSAITPQGAWDYVVSGARDYSGNQNTVPASGTMQISLYSQAPFATLNVWTQQPLLTGSTWLANQPFSSPANNGAASLTIAYAVGPFNTPHTLKMYNASNIQVATYSLPIAATTNIPLTLDTASWTSAPGLAEAFGPAAFRFRIVDSLDNLSAELNAAGGIVASLTYDSKPASVTGFVFSDTGIASGGIKYYSPAVSGNTTITLSTNATDPQRLVIVDTDAPATWTVPMAQPISMTHSVATGSGLPEGLYAFSAADLAGNFATGPEYLRFVQVDASQPVVISVTPSTVTAGSPIRTTAAGAATFDVTFSEPMSSATIPIVSLTNGAFSTSLVASPTSSACWISSTTCRFVNSAAIVATFPQGIYSYGISAGRDYAGNTTVPSNGAFQLEIQARGPTVTSYLTRSQQFTTAGATEYFTGQPFSHLVAPNAATLTVTLSTASGSGTFLHFIQNNITVASVTLAWNGGNTVGTFTWDVATGPVPVNGSPYTLRLVDQFGNPSLETGTWTMDATAPVVLSAPSVFGGRTASGTTYANAPLTFRFQAAESQAPRLRAWTGVSTDTYSMVATSGTTMWSGAWNLYESRNTLQKATDGVYLVDIVDAAGNVGTPTTGLATWSCRVVIDSTAPVVASYALKLNGTTVTRFAPAAASLTIEVSAPTETLTETGIYWVDVLDRWSRLITRLPLIASGSIFEAKWDGTNSSGMLVTDDNYILVATDYAGNRSALTAAIFVSTAGFRVISATEISSGSVDLLFSLPFNQAGVQNADFSIPNGLSVATFSVRSTTLLRLTFNSGMSHGADVPITVNVGSITSDELVPIAAPGNIATVTAVDARGPVISDIKLAGLAGPNYFKAVFDEQITESTAETVSNYALTAPGRTVSLSNVTLQADGCSVTASASETLAEGTSYTLTATGVEDRFLNRSTSALASFTFQGADVTPPVITLAAFSNAGNERDIIIAVKVNEALLNGGSPTLTVTPSTGTAVSVSLNQAQALTWTAGYHLTSNVGSVLISVTARDATGNSSTKSLTFTIATVNANVEASLASADGMMTAGFNRKSLKSKAFVKILPHELDYISSHTIAAGITPKLSAAIRRSVSGAAAKLASQASELVPIGLAYEISVSQSALGSGFGVTAKLPAGVAKNGVALYRQADDQSWQVVGTGGSNGWINTGGNRPGTFALLRDRFAPRLSVTTDVPAGKPLTTARPRFEGRVEEYGSGLNADSLVARVDGESAQPVTLLEDGTIVFVPLEDLTGGRHELIFEAEDLAGNKAVTPAVRFDVQVPLAIGEISIYPNPARIRSTIRISANRRDIDPDLIDVHIYDTAGHRVRTLSGVSAVREAAGASARFLYDLAWDLRNEDDDTVANGVYLAKIVVRDPDNPERKVKKIHKIAVLR